MPAALPPHGSNLVPSGLVLTADTNVQVPTSCSLSDFCWATASPVSGTNRSANIVSAANTSHKRRRIVLVVIRPSIRYRSRPALLPFALLAFVFMAHLLLGWCYGLLFLTFSLALKIQALCL